MSMAMLTVLQVSIIFILYTVVTCLLPLVVINRLVPGLRMSEKFLLAIVSGNFYIVNEVLILQLLHISNRITLLSGALFPFAAVTFWVYHLSPAVIASKIGHIFGRILQRTLGLKSFLLEMIRRGGGWLRQRSAQLFSYVCAHPVDAFLFVGVSVLVTAIYLPTLLESYGYKAFDIPVHNYWINALGWGDLFVAGVYPFGFHCVIYYLHAVFGIQTYVLLRVFCLVQTLYIHWALLFFLKAALKQGYLAYLGTAVYAAADLFERSTYSRYGASLPQEFGMIFILPAIYFGFAFFKTRKKWCLAGFAMSFSLTLAVHFYGTMIAGLFSVAMAFGFFFRFFKKQYLVPILVTCVISVASAVAPMAIAFAGGTPLQGSLNWGLGIIAGSEEESTETGAEIAETDETVEGEESPSEEAGEGADLAVSESTETGIAADISTDGAADAAEVESFLSRLEKKAGWLIKKVSLSIDWNVSKHDSKYFLAAVYGSIGLCALLALLYLFLRETDLAGRLLTVAGYMSLMSLLLASSQLGLPTLMDASRTSIYYCYSLPVLWCLALEGLLYLPARLLRRRRIYRTATLFVLIAAVVLAGNYDLVRGALSSTAIESNDAITCLTNIMAENDDNTWTIVSANDEYRMVEDTGYHYETITFLREIENIGRFSGVTIPTKYTYFFVEKVPIEYYITYEEQGQSISRLGAAKGLPVSSGIEPYEGENRWIVMSRMYYWAETFREMYPENMTVYYESDTFICYQLEQNIDHLFELGIDYGYNNYYE